MNVIDRAIATFSPRAGLRRAQARAALEAMAHYRAASVPRRSASVRAAGGDADAISTTARRQISLAVRDVVRNNPLAERAVQVLVNSIIGTGIEPKLISDDTALHDGWPQHLALLDSTRIDAEGVSTLAGIQRLMVRAMVIDGEVLLVFPREQTRDSFFQVRVLEIDYLDDRINGRAAEGGNTVYDGIEYDDAGRVVAYHLHDEHPGSPVWHANWKGLTSTRVDASRVIHLYRVDRPGQRRGVSWFAPVLDDMVALADNDEAQLVRQKIAACFAAFWRSDKTPDAAGVPLKLAPGLIQQIGSDDDVTFATPPDVSGYDDFAKHHLRRIAVGLGITYESLTGDLTGVNFSSGRIGRIDAGQSVEAWQWTVVIPRLCAPMGQWFLKALAYENPGQIAALHAARIIHTPPPPVIADPKNETQVAVQRIEAGLTSRHAEIRRSGYDPAEIDAEILRDNEMRQALSALKAPSVAASAQAEAERNLDA